MLVEKGVGWRRSIVQLPKEITLTRFSLGLTTFLMAATGPLVILLAAANQAHLPLEITISWIFINYLTSGVTMVVLSLYYRQPLIMAWSIPGAALAGEALKHNSFSDVQGAYIITALLMLGLGLSGTMRKIISLIPPPVLMGMLCGILLPYEIAIFTSINTIAVVTLPSLGIYLLLRLLQPVIGNRFPPILVALMLALLLATLTGATNWAALELKPASLVFSLPTFNLSTILEISLPLMIAALSIGDSQAYTMLVSQGYNPPLNAMTSSSGLVSFINALFGGHTACLGGILQGIIGGPEAGAREGRYAGVVSQSGLWISLALFAPVAASINKVLLQNALVPMLGGIALINVTLGAFQQAFSGKFKLSAFFAFIITFSNFKFANMGSAFWGIAAGLILAYLFERADFKK